MGSQTPFLRSNVWHALNASGALIGIPAALIEQIARAYHRIEVTSFVEREAFRLSLDPMVRTIRVAERRGCWRRTFATRGGP